MSFSYLRDQSQGFGKALWNCNEFKRPSPVQCMRRMPMQPAAVPTPLTESDPKRAAAPDGLTGIRRKSDAVVPPVVTVPAAQPAPAR